MKSPRNSCNDTNINHFYDDSVMILAARLISLFFTLAFLEDRTLFHSLAVLA